MSTCFSCGNAAQPGTKRCSYCGKEFHHTHFIVFKKKKEEKSVSGNPVLRRFSASVIDTLYMAAPFLAGLFFLEQPLAETSVGQFAIQTWFLFVIFGALQLFLLVHDGQTVGKKMMKLAIVDHKTNSTPNAFRVLFLRTALPLIPFVLPVIGVGFFIVNLAWMLGGEQRCLHDYIAGTNVIDE